jgi:hypothetical protein
LAFLHGAVAGFTTLQEALLLLVSLLCWWSCFCFPPVVACIHSVVGGHAIAVILTVADVTTVACFSAVARIPVVVGIRAVAIVTSVPYVLNAAETVF